MEIEDAVSLLREEDKYTDSQTRLCDEHGENQIVDNMWEQLGADRAH